MDLDKRALPPEASEMKAEFRKPSSDSASRKYRRRSPVSGSCSPDGSPKHEHNTDPIFSMGDPAKAPEHRQRRNDDERELGRITGRSQFSKGGDSYRYSDRHSFRSSHIYSGHNDHSRRDKRGDDEERPPKASSHSSWGSRAASYSDHAREEREPGGRSRDWQDADRNSRDVHDILGQRSKDKEKDSLERHKYKEKDLSPDRAGSDRKYTNSTSEEKDRDWHRRDRDVNEKRDYYRSSGDHRSDRSYYHEESRGYRNDTSGRDQDRYCSRETYKNDRKEPSGRREKKKHESLQTKRDNDRYSKATGEKNEDKSVLRSEDQESLAKKSKLFTDGKTDDTQSSTIVANEKWTSKQGQGNDGKITGGLAQAENPGASNDLNAAKVAAMKAAELVNKNLVGGSFMTTEQKKKLLWGNKKITTAEEPGHRWDTSLFGDHERREKFNKLMGVKGEANSEHNPDNQDGSLQAEKQKELQMDLEKQYTAGLRRRDGRTVGLGL